MQEFPEPGQIGIAPEVFKANFGEVMKGKGYARKER